MYGSKPPIHFDKKDNVLARSNYFIGDVDKGMEEAETVVKGTYKTPIVQHCHIENPISYAYMEKGRIVVVTSTQIPHIVRRVIGQALGIPWGNIRVIKPYIGGGFGNKQDVLYEPLNAFLTTQVGGRPVKLDVSREETFCNTRTRHAIEFDLAAGVDKEGKLVTGFYAARTHAIIPVEDCLLGVKENKDVLMAVKEWMLLKQIPAYDETTGTGLVRHILIRYGFTTEEVMVCLIINGDRLPEKETLIERLSVLPGMTSISYNVNTERTNVILGKHTECIWGMPYITDYIHLRNTGDFSVEDTAIAYHISPQSFYQVNPVQTEKLYSTALEYAKLTGKESVWDLYCGIGTISLFLSQKAKQVYGVEIVPQAIEDAKNNAALNGITNAEFFVGKAEEVLPQFYNSDDLDAGMRHPDVIVVDPPRKGCDEQCLSTMLAMKPQRIVYVSCDSATLARDLRILVDGGYELRKVRAFDQFAHTGHVETVCLMSRKEK